MLDFGFSNYALYSEAETELEDVDVLRGTADNIVVYSSSFAKLISKADKKKVEKEYNIPETLSAPLKSGDVVGSVVYKLNGEIVGKSDVFVKDDVAEIKVGTLFARILKTIFTGKY